MCGGELDHEEIGHMMGRYINGQHIDGSDGGWYNESKFIELAIMKAKYQPAFLILSLIGSQIRV